MNTGADGGDWSAEHIVCLRRDIAERLAKGNGVGSLRPRQVRVVTLKDPDAAHSGIIVLRFVLRFLTSTASI
jgi:hypothetical protein